MPKPAPSLPPTQEEYEAALAEHEGPSAFGDVLTAITGSEEDAMAARARTRERISDTADEFIAHPLDTALGAGQGATLGWLDEMAGAANAATRGQRESQATALGLGERPPEEAQQVLEESYTVPRDRVRAATRTARTRSPTTYAAGDILGNLASAVATPEVRLAEGAGLGLRAARAGLEGAGFGAALGAGEAEEDVAQRTAEGAGMGLAGGLLVGVPMEGTRSLYRAGREFFTPARADRGRVAASMGRTTLPPRIEQALADIFPQASDPVAAAASTARRTGLSGPRRGTPIVEAVSDEGLGPVASREAQRRRALDLGIAGHSSVEDALTEVLRAGRNVPQETVDRSLADLAAQLEAQGADTTFVNLLGGVLEEPAEGAGVPAIDIFDVLGDFHGLEGRPEVEAMRQSLLDMALSPEVMASLPSAQSRRLADLAAEELVRTGPRPTDLPTLLGDMGIGAGSGALAGHGGQEALGAAVGGSLPVLREAGGRILSSRGPTAQATMLETLADLLGRDLPASPEAERLARRVLPTTQ